MFSAHCRTCSTTVLLDLDQIVALTPSGEHWVVEALCWCGASVIAELRRPVRRRPHAVVDAAALDRESGPSAAMA